MKPEEEPTGCVTFLPSLQLRFHSDVQLCCPSPKTRDVGPQGETAAAAVARRQAQAAAALQSVANIISSWFQFLVKVKSSISAGKVVDKSSISEDCKYEKFGLNAVVPLALGLLRSKGFQEWVVQLFEHRQEELAKVFLHPTAPALSRKEVLKALLDSRSGSTSPASGAGGSRGGSKTTGGRKKTAPAKRRATAAVAAATDEEGDSGNETVLPLPGETTAAGRKKGKINSREPAKKKKQKRFAAAAAALNLGGAPTTLRLEPTSRWPLGTSGEEEGGGGEEEEEEESLREGVIPSSDENDA